VRVDLAAYRVHRPGGEQELTPIEVDLLRYLVAHRGRVLDRGQILKDLWGVERRHETRTLDNHVARLRKKIELDPATPRFLKTVHGVGYRFEEA
jgi:DNA-binding response OmpR family regulator